MDLHIIKIAEKVLGGDLICLEEALGLAETIDLDTLFKYAGRIRKKFSGPRVDLCSIMNAKSGACSENCKFCAQSGHYQTGIKAYTLTDPEETLKVAQKTEEAGVGRFSLVTSGKVIDDQDFAKIIAIYDVLKRETSLDLCASLGCISYSQAVQLKEIGVRMYHHNLETSRDFYPQICDTHSYDERVRTIKDTLRAGLEVCCGGIIGLGESIEERMKMIFEVRELGIKSIPVNVLTPIPGTPLEKMRRLKPLEILKTIAIFRFVIPDARIRYAGGRDALGESQSLGFAVGVNGALVGDYLTTVGNKISDDQRMIIEAGLIY